MTEQLPLLEALTRRFPESSKRTLRHWIKWGRVLVDGVPAKGAMISQTANLDVARKQLAPLPILYEDRWFIAVNKPPKLLSVPAERKRESALLLLREHLRSSQIFAAHRLDRDASGLLLFVRGEEMRDEMAARFGAHCLEREYAAIVEGRLAQQEGSWTFPLEEQANFDVIVSEEGQEAHTDYRRVRRTAQFTHLHVTLKTGRKHQIRVHAAQVGHPLIGDRRYGALTNPIHRLGLHAKRLAFEHPVTGRFIEIRAPLPKSFEALGYPCEVSQ